MSHDDETSLWVAGDLCCVMVSCCAGAELQLRRLGPGPAPEYDIVLRELYPSRADVHERARML